MWRSAVKSDCSFLNWYETVGTEMDLKNRMRSVAGSAMMNVGSADCWEGSLKWTVSWKVWSLRVMGWMAWMEGWLVISSWKSLMMDGFLLVCLAISAGGHETGMIVEQGVTELGEGGDLEGGGEVGD